MQRWLVFPCLLGALLLGCGSSSAPPPTTPAPAAAADGEEPGPKGTGQGAGSFGLIGTEVEPADDPLRTDGSHTTDEALVGLLQEMGMVDVKVLDPGKLSFRMDTDVAALFRLDDGDLQLYYGIGGVECPLEAINDWNTRYRHSRAYVDREGDPVIESDLLSDGGVSRHKLRIFVRTFYLSVSEFRDLLRARCKLPGQSGAADPSA